MDYKIYNTIKFENGVKAKTGDIIKVSDRSKSYTGKLIEVDNFLVRLDTSSEYNSSTKTIYHADIVDVTLLRECE